MMALIFTLMTLVVLITYLLPYSVISLCSVIFLTGLVEPAILDVDADSNLIHACSPKALLSVEHHPVD